MPRTKKIKSEETKEKNSSKKEVVKDDAVVEQPAEAKQEEGKEASSSQKKSQKPSKPEREYYFGYGRRKTATARARLYLPNREVVIAGKKLERGEVYVNGVPIEKYFSDPFSKAIYSEIYRTTNSTGRFITTVVSSGSGKSGQLGATVLAISRALTLVDPRFRPILRKRGFLTRDPRAKERKKPGLMGARKEKQSPKR